MYLNHLTERSVYTQQADYFSFSRPFHAIKVLLEIMKDSIENRKVHLTQIMIIYIRCTEIKVAVKFCFSLNLTSFDREFHGGHKYGYLAFFQLFFLVEKLKKHERCRKHIIWQIFLDLLSF